MHLNALIEQINQRKESLIQFNFFSAKGAIASGFSSGALEFHDAFVKLKLKKELFIFQSYLIELMEIQVNSEEEMQKIKSTIDELHDILTQLYKIFSENYGPASVQELKQKQSLLANYNLIDGAEDNDIALFEAALKAGANVNFRYLDKYPLALAAGHGNFNMAKQLIDRGATVDGNGKEDTLLIKAVVANNLQLVQLLIEKGADVNKIVTSQYSNDYKNTALLAAFFHPNVSLEIINYLLAIPTIDVNMNFIGVHYTRRSVLAVALNQIIHSEDTEKVKALLQVPGLIKKPMDFETSISLGLDAVRLLVDAGYTCNGKSFKEAIHGANAPVIDFLLEQESTEIDGVKDSLIEYDLYTDLMFYVAIGNIIEVGKLLNNAALEEINEHNETALMLAARLGRIDIAELLLNRGANVNAVNHYGLTSLMLAAEKGHSGMVTLLLQHKADTSLKERGSVPHKNALMIAQKANHHEIVQIMNQHQEAQSIAIKSAEETRAREQKLLRNASVEIERIHKLLQTKLTTELKDFLLRKGIVVDELKPADRSRYQLVQDLLSTVDTITRSTKEKLSIDNIDNWKQEYQNQLSTAVVDSLKDPRLDKYGSLEKLGILLLNFITVIFSPIKKIATGSFFYSSTGKSKEVVEEIKQIVDTSLSTNTKLDTLKKSSSPPEKSDTSADLVIKPK